MLKEFNINSPEELFFSKYEYDRLNREKAESENKEYVNTTLENYLSKIDLSKEVFVYQDEEEELTVIPFKILEHNDEELLIYADNSKDKKVYEMFKKYLSNRKTVKLRMMSLDKYHEENFKNRCYIIKQHNIYLFD